MVAAHDLANAIATLCVTSFSFAERDGEIEVFYQTRSSSPEVPIEFRQCLVHAWQIG